MSKRTVSESTSDQRSSRPRRQYGSKVELDALIRPFLDFSSQVDQVLNTGRVEVGDGGEIQNDRSAKRSRCRAIVLDRLTLLGTRVVPRSVSELDIAHILPTPRVLLDMIDDGRVDERRVGVEERLFESIDDDTFGRGFDLDGRVGDPTVATEGHVDVPDIRQAGRVFRPDPDTTEEVSTGTSDTEEQEDDRGGQRGVDTVFDRAEYGDDDGGGEDDPFEGGDSPESI